MRITGEYIKVFGPAILLVSFGCVFAYQFVDPAPPRRKSIATASPSGAYFAYGGDYSELLKRNGIRLEVLPTAGSVENIRIA
jgi:TRAP-type uncharacterized transport system substrate-binding protein